jgi:hypothetical protein
MGVSPVWSKRQTPTGETPVLLKYDNTNPPTIMHNATPPLDAASRNG